MTHTNLSVLSWNINSLRSKIKLLYEFNNVDIICIQESKLTKGLPYLMKLNDYYDFHSINETKKGYSGVSIYTKIMPLKVIKPPWDDEGRILVLEFDNLYLINVYVPNAGQKLERLKYKINIWMNDFIHFINKLNKNFIIVGDFNATASNNKIDIHTHQPNSAGNTPPEVWMFNYFLNKTNSIDTFRYLYPKTKKYTYWSNFGNARKNNKGWRIDYILVNNNLIKYVNNTEVLTDVIGSDHVPLLLNISIDF